MTGGATAQGPGNRFANTLLRDDGARFVAEPEKLQTKACGNATLVVVAKDAQVAGRSSTRLILPHLLASALRHAGGQPEGEGIREVVATRRGRPPRYPGLRWIRGLVRRAGPYLQRTCAEPRPVTTGPQRYGKRRGRNPTCLDRFCPFFCGAWLTSADGTSSMRLLAGPSAAPLPGMSLLHQGLPQTS